MSGFWTRDRRGNVKFPKWEWREIRPDPEEPYREKIWAGVEVGGPTKGFLFKVGDEFHRIESGRWVVRTTRNRILPQGINPIQKNKPFS